MISGDERRRAVAELREASTGAYRHVDALDVIADSVGVEVDGRFSLEIEKETYAALAELIDRPTCHMEGTSRSGFRCSACGEQIPPMRIFYRDSAGDHWVPMEHNRCPMCGAEVVSNGQGD